MFRQDYRINKIFLPSQLLARRGLPSGLEAAPAGTKASGIWFSRLHHGSEEKNPVNPVNPVRKYFGFMSK